MGWVSAIGKQVAKTVQDAPVAEAVVKSVQDNAGATALGAGVGAVLPADTTEERLANMAALAGGAITARNLVRSPAQASEAERYLEGPGTEVMGVFGGISARNAPLPKLERAKAMEAAGADPKSVWKETGWLRGEEGAWKFEIDDSKAMMLVDAPRVAWEFDLADMFDHPELYEAYPELKQAQIVFQDMGPVVRNERGEITRGATGAFDPFFRTVIVNNRLTREEAAEVALHEIQHAVQDTEGFARGGSPEPGKEYMETPQIEAAFVRLGDLKLKHDRATDPMQKQMIKAQMDTLSAKITEQAQIEHYQRLPGEVEARLVERRRKMSEAERAGTFPKEQYDMAPFRSGPGAEPQTIQQALSNPDADVLLLTKDMEIRAAQFEAPGSPEYEAAVAKGLDPSKEARLARAEEQGFDTSKVWYHGTAQNFDQFSRVAGAQRNSPKGRINPRDDSLLGVHVGTSEQAQAILDNDGATTGAQILPLFVRAKKSMRLEDMGRWTPEGLALQLGKRGIMVQSSGIQSDGRPMFLMQDIRDELKRLGYDSIIYANKFEGPKGRDSLIILDENNIRSVNAMFDPDATRSPNLLASQRGGPLDDEPLPPGRPQPAPTFYSALGKFVSSNKTAKASAAQWKGMIQNAPGIKAEEVEWTGVMEWLDLQDGAVTREALAEFVEANGVRVEEVVRGGLSVSAEDQAALLPLIEELDRLNDEILNAELNLNEGSMDINEYESFVAERDPRMTELAREIDRIQGATGRFNEDTKWSTYTLPGGENYREMLLTLPEEMEPVPISVEPSPDGKAFDVLRDDGGVKSLVSRHRTIEEANSAASAANMSRKTSNQFRSSHWSEPNVLAHVRFKERTGPNGERVLALEEIQSDWHQAGRERGYVNAEAKAAVDKATADGIAARSEMIAALTDPSVIEKINARGTSSEKEMLAMVQRGMHITDQHLRTMLMNFFRDPSLPDGVGARMNAAIKAYEASDAAYKTAQRAMQSGVPNAPFKNNAWTELVLKRMIRFAAENGFDAVAWIPGNIQNGRVVETDDNRGDFYDKIVPNAANKLGKKYGARVVDLPLDAATRDEGNRRLGYEVVDENGDQYDSFDTIQAAQQAAEDAGPGYAVRGLGAPPVMFHSLPITPELRDVAVNEGFPMFSKRGGPLDDMDLTDAMPEETPQGRNIVGSIAEAGLFAGAAAGAAGAAGIALGWDGIQRTEPEKPPEDMTPAEFERWKAQEIAIMQAEKAAAQEQRAEAPVSYNPLPMTPEAEQNMGQTEEMLAIKERNRRMRQ